MVSHRAQRAFRSFAAFGLAVVALTLLAACDGGDDDDTKATATEPQVTVQEGTETPDGTPSASETETGEAPFFWRTEDNFESLRAAVPYKVGLRVTNGYDEDTLLVVAEGEGGAREEFPAPRVEPVGEEDPGTFYHFLLELPEPGTWQVTAVAGDDQVTITVEVGPAG